MLFLRDVWVYTFGYTHRCLLFWWASEVMRSNADNQVMQSKLLQATHHLAQLPQRPLTSDRSGRDCSDMVYLWYWTAFLPLTFLRQYECVKWLFTVGMKVSQASLKHNLLPLPKPTYIYWIPFATGEPFNTFSSIFFTTFLFRCLWSWGSRTSDLLQRKLLDLPIPSRSPPP